MRRKCCKLWGIYSSKECEKKNMRNGWHYTFNVPFYVPLKKTVFQALELVIKTDEGDIASFLETPSYLTLHFKRFSVHHTHE